jgi:MOSC domain-containing protein YiiM
MQGKVVAVCTSPGKGTPKSDCGEATLRVDHGLVGDAHAAPGDRQISLLAVESVDKMRALGLDVGVGSFGENLAISGLPLPTLPIGTKLRVGGECLLEITMIGKTCHRRCSIYYRAGDCIMPREGVFAKVLAGGAVSTGDDVTVLE